ncbi:MAG: hypothetical protein KF696_14755 [Planctomycetes bacterium]|nr:hypothetical protein [Planctomycetota bacterium]MCW8137122.1 hypothetical protein [Planctomycetota bacterium]
MMRPQRLKWIRVGVVAVMAMFIALPVVSAQDDDDFYKEVRKKKAREKAIAEGKDPDAQPEPPPEKPKLPADADGWMSYIQRRWNSTKPEELQTVREAADKLKEAIGTEQALREKVVKNFQGFKEKEAERELQDAIRKSGVTVEKLRVVLDESRPLALKAIMNPRYTEADNCKLQPEVDKACAPLFAVWRDPVGYSVDKFGLDLKAPGARLDGLATLLGEFDPALASWGENVTDAEAYMKSRGREFLNVSEREYKANRKLLDANDAMQGGTLTEEDKRHVRVLNDYRMMLGKGCLAINLQLCQACTGHSKYQEKIGRIGHNIDGHPEGRTPQDRARRAGFAGSVAENCLMGAADGAAAVWQWYNAAEHHRNMIANHSIIGVGHSGVYWTQNFSGGSRQ